MTRPANAPRASFPTVEQLGSLGLLSVAYSAVAVAALHLLDTEFDPVDDFLSEYALGDYGWLMRSVFVASGLGALAIALGLWRSLPRDKQAAAGALGVAVTGVGFIVAGIFETDTEDAAGEVETTATGLVHDLASSTLFLSVIIAAFLLWRVFAAAPSWRALSRPTLGFAIALVVFRVATIAVPEGGPVGLPQRVLAALMMGWLALLAWWLVRASDRRESRSG